MCFCVFKDLQCTVVLIPCQLLARVLLFFVCAGGDPHDASLESVVLLVRVDLCRKHRAPHREGQFDIEEFVESSSMEKPKLRIGKVLFFGGAPGLVFVGICVRRQVRQFSIVLGVFRLFFVGALCRLTLTVDHAAGHPLNFVW